jgi:hypothetical protein
MRASALVISAFAALFLSASADAQTVKPVYKVDSASAKIVNQHLVISAQGAVRTGGWENPHLHVKEVYVPEADTLVVEFLATPPSKKDVVIQMVVPVSATVTTGVPHDAMTQVKIVSETNSVTVPITH